jgi:hypothetical protein
MADRQLRILSNPLNGNSTTRQIRSTVGAWGIANVIV